jgi:hypothetical protein
VLPIPSLLLAFVLGTVATEPPPATAPATDATKMVRYTDKPHGFSFERPESWEKSPNPNANIVVMFLDALSGPGDRMRENISIVVMDIGGNPDVTLEKVLPVVRDSLQKKFSEVRFVEDAPMKLAGQDAHKLLYTAKMKGVDLKMTQVMSVANSRFYTITFTSTPDGFPKYEAVLTRMLESFQFEH